MSQRFFECEQITKAYAKYRPTPPKQLTDRIVSFLKEKYKGDLNLCLDVGCGNGQCTVLFSSHLNNVLGFDVSPMQVEIAKGLNYPTNVEFQISSAEHLPVESNSVQIVNAATSAHWFDLPAFYKEVDRILVPLGVAALSCYSPDSFVILHPSKSDQLTEEFKKFYLEKLRPFYGAATHGIQRTLNGYADITLPYEEALREEVWTEEMTITLAGLAALFSTTTPYQEYCRINGEEAGKHLLDGFVNDCRNIMDTDDESPNSLELKVKVKYFLLMGRKPGPL